MITPIPPKKQRALRRWWFVTVVACAATVLLLSGLTWLQQQTMTHALRELEKTNKHVAHAQHTSHELAQLQHTHDTLTQRVAVFDTATHASTLPHQLLTAISEMIPDDVMLDAVTFSENNNMALRGIAKTTTAVTTFVRELEVHELFDKVTLVSLHQAGGDPELMQFAIRSAVLLRSP